MSEYYFNKSSGLPFIHIKEIDSRRGLFVTPHSEIKPLEYRFFVGPYDEEEDTCPEILEDQRKRYQKYLDDKEEDETEYLKRTLSNPSGREFLKIREELTRIRSYDKTTQ